VKGREVKGGRYLGLCRSIGDVVPKTMLYMGEIVQNEKEVRKVKPWKW